MPDLPRVAYAITSYKLPGQVLRLARTLRKGSPNAPIVIHHDDRWSRLDRQALQDIEALLVEPPSRVAWGEFSQLAMVLRLLESVSRAASFDWLVLLSGQDYPVRPVREIERSLGEASVDAFIGARRCDPPPLRRSVGEFGLRYYYRWWPVPRWLGWPLQRVAWRTFPLIGARTMPSGVWLGVRAMRTPFGPELVCHCGSDWFTLSRDAAEAIQRFLHDRPEVLAYYRRTLIPTESFVHTVLENADGLRLSHDNRRYLVFDAPRQPVPRVLGVGDVEAVLRSGADFARKFDETVDARALDEIDRQLH